LPLHSVSKFGILQLHAKITLKVEFIKIIIFPG